MTFQYGQMKMLLLVLATWASATGVAADADEAQAKSLDQVRRQFQQFCLEDLPPDLEQAAKFAASLRGDGSWSDVDYESRERAAWPVRKHLSRVLVMAKAARVGGTSAYRQEALIRLVHRALAFWRRHDYQAPSWFHNLIAVPETLGEIALLLDDQLPPEDFTYITETVMRRCSIGTSTGQNRVWLAGCNLMDGLIRRDAQKVAKIAPIIFAGVAIVTDKEGIQRDFSFHQHGPQQQFGCYGLSFAQDQIKWMATLRDTPWAMSATQQEILRGYLLKGLNWTAWRGALDISSCGRWIEPDSPVVKGQVASEVMTQMSRLDPPHAGEYLSFVKRNQPAAVNDLIGCQFFWRSDYLVQRRIDFCITLKMCSARVIGSESLNLQNLSGYYLGDGATYLHRTGDEYRNIFPVWDWRMIPGVTCAQNQGELPKFGAYRLDTRFVGGVTDGSNACAVLDYHRDGVSARKSWFFGGDQIVCLGSGVGATARVTVPIVTTIEQCRLRGKVRISDGKSETTLKAGSHTFDNLQWVEHDGVRYLLGGRQQVNISNERRTGNWHRVARRISIPKEDVSQEVFTLIIGHGTQPKNGTYAYGILPVPGKRREQFEILSNTEKLQAVRFDGKQVGAIFHAPGRFNYGHTITVDSPCVVLLDVSDRVLRVTAADPTQRLKTLGLELDGKRHVVQLPAGNESGKSVSVELAK